MFIQLMGCGKVDYETDIQLKVAHLNGRGHDDYIDYFYWLSRTIDGRAERQTRNHKK